MPLFLLRFFVRNHLPLPEGWWLEIWSAITIAAWAIVAIILGADFSGIPTYRLAMEVMTSNEWKGTGLCVAAAQLLACQHRCPTWRKWVAFGPMAWYFGLAWSLWFSTVPNFQGTVMYAAMGFANVTAVFLMRRERHVQRGLA